MFQCDDAKCCIIQFLPPDDQHIVLETCIGIQQTYYKTRFCALSWLITKMILRCTVSRMSKRLKIVRSLGNKSPIYVTVRQPYIQQGVYNDTCPEEK